MQKLRFHVVSLPHTQTTKKYNACAYTEKVRKFCTMMKDLDHTVYLYSSEDNEALCDEHIACITKKEQEEMLGQNDFHKEFFNVEWDPKLPYWQVMNTNAIKAIKQRAEKRDFICLIGGVCQKDIADAFPELINVEFGIGYSGVFSKYKVFESYAWMHYVYGLMRDDNGKFFDCVIPNYFETGDFPQGEGQGDYYLYLGRLIERKGIQIAIETTKRIGAKLLIAGQGVIDYKPGVLVTKEGTYYGEHIEYVGYADVKKRAELMGAAKAVFVPTTYLEPFGGVAIESMLCGSPIITTDFGAFTETNLHGKTGYRCHTLDDFIWAAKNAPKLDRSTISQYARSNYSTDRVKHMYNHYFAQLYTLWAEGWYQLMDNEDPKYRQWLSKNYF